MQYLSIEEPPAPPQPRWALWELGFRPFYLLAAAFGALSIALWSLQFTGLLSAPYLAGPMWHAHEMLFGFTLAVIAGFLFTAGRNWSNQPTPTGARLALLAALWVAGRVLVLTPYGVAAAIVNTAFPLACAVALGIPFWRARNRRNYFFVGLLLLLAGAALLIHLDRLGVAPLPGWAGVQIALDVVLFILSVMGGRVIPMFTNNGVPGADAKRLAWLDRAALASVLAVLAADAAGLTAPLPALALLAAAAHAARWMMWRPWRTAKGHTARVLRADKWDTACYMLVLAAALVRVGVPLVAPAALLEAVLLSAVLWSSAFAVYVGRYWGVLTRARVDGRPG